MDEKIKKGRLVRIPGATVKPQPDARDARFLPPTERFCMVRREDDEYDEFSFLIYHAITDKGGRIVIPEQVRTYAPGNLDDRIVPQFDSFVQELSEIPDDGRYYGVPVATVKAAYSDFLQFDEQTNPMSGDLRDYGMTVVVDDQDKHLL